MKEKIILDMLTQDSVSVVKQKFITVEEAEYPISDIWRKSYMNSIRGREEVKKELEVQYVTAIFAVWGDIPTIEE